jgi:hypothetical protein
LPPGLHGTPTSIGPSIPSVTPFLTKQGTPGPNAAGFIWQNDITLPSQWCLKWHQTYHSLDSRRWRVESPATRCHRLPTWAAAVIIPLHGKMCGMPDTGNSQARRVGDPQTQPGHSVGHHARLAPALSSTPQPPILGVTQRRIEGHPQTPGKGALPLCTPNGTGIPAQAAIHERDLLLAASSAPWPPTPPEP